MTFLDVLVHSKTMIITDSSFIHGIQGDQMGNDTMNCVIVMKNMINHIDRSSDNSVFSKLPFIE